MIILLWFLVNMSFAAESTDTTIIGYFINTLFHEDTIWPLLFSVYNYGIIVVAMMMISFSVLYTGALYASDGAEFSRKMSIWVLIRSFAGVALLIPYGPNQFALIQYIVLKLVKWSIWFSGFVFSGVAMSVGGAMVDQPVGSDSLVNSSYTEMVKMAYCGLSYAPDLSVMYNGSEVPLALSWSGSDNTYYFKGVPECGAISPPQGSPAVENGLYSVVMQSILSQARATVRGVIRKEQIEFDKAPSSYMVTRLCSEGEEGCWNNIFLRSVYNHYTLLINPDLTLLQSQPANNNSVTIDTLIKDFFHIVKSLATKNTTASSAAPQYIVPTYGRMVQKNSIDWRKATVNPLSPEDESEVLLKANQRYTKDSQQGLLSDRTMRSYQEEEEQAYRVAKARAEIANQVYRLMFNEINSFSGGWSDSAVKREQASLYRGTPGVQTHIAYLIGSVSLPRDHSSYIASEGGVGLNIHVIQDGIDTMVKRSITAITGCDIFGCNKQFGLFGFQKQYDSNNTQRYSISPIDFIRHMGFEMLAAANEYQAKTILGDDGVVMMDNKIAEAIYATTSGLITARAAAEAASSIYPTTSHTRAVGFGLHAGFAEIMEMYGYFGDLDAYALYQYEPIGSSISNILMIWGGFYGIFLPSVPPMIVMFALIGWIFLIIEAMIATPLIALGLTHPNNQQFLGASDQTLMMFLLLALRPATIMIGVFMAIYLSEAAIRLLNEGVIRFMEIFLGGFVYGIPGVATSSVHAVYIVLLMSIMLVYSYVIFVVLVQAYSLIGTLPDKIGSWIGMSAMGGTNVMQQVMGVRSSFESGAQQAAQGGSSVSNSKLGSHADDGINYAKLTRADKIADRKDAINTTRAILSKDASKFTTDGLSGKTQKFAKSVISNKTLSFSEKAKLLKDIRRTKALGTFLGPSAKQFSKSDGHDDLLKKGKISYHLSSNFERLKEASKKDDVPVSKLLLSSALGGFILSPAQSIGTLLTVPVAYLVEKRVERAVRQQDQQNQGDQE